MLEDKLRENATVVSAELKDGRVPEAADILFVAAPESLDNKQLFAVDQFLMKGGTVVIASSPYKTSMRGQLDILPTPSGLEDWLAFNGLTLQKSLVLDPQNSPFPIPVERNVGGLKLQQIQLLDYPYFVDARQDGLAQQKAPTTGLSQLTVSWASPIKVDETAAKGRKRRAPDREFAQLLDIGSARCGAGLQGHPRLGFAEGKDRGRQLIGAMMEGQFKSFFAGKPSPLAKDAKPEEAKDKAGASGKDAASGDKTAAGKPDAKADDKDKKPTITGVIERSPESGRIILVASSTFLSDDILNLSSSVNQTQYLAPLTFAQNAVDWSLEDRGLLSLRSRGGQFSRTLEPMTAGMEAFWEYLNYGLALLGLGIVYLVRRVMRKSARRRYAAMLGFEGA